MLDHVFTDAIGALRETLESAFLERQKDVEERFQVDVLLGDVTWETSYGLPGEGFPPRVVAVVTFDWPTWSQTAYRLWLQDEQIDDPPRIEIEIRLRIQRLAAHPNAELVLAALPSQSPPIGTSAPLERFGPTVETLYRDPLEDPAYAIEVSYEGTYELTEEPLADGSILDDHFERDGRLDRIDARSARRPQARVLASRRGGGAAVTDAPVVLEVSNRVATVTLNRPEARNALSSEVLRLLPASMREADGRDDVDVVILTGADPAFCAGLDLKELGSAGGNLRAGNADGRTDDATTHGPFPAMDKPVIGAINGPAITGGFELALNCDFLVASDRARFGDTHTRVGVMPGWGLTVLLPQAIGVRRAKEMSFTGNFLDADEAFSWGLVNHVVPHAELLPFCRELAADISGNDQRGVRQIRKTYDAVAAGPIGDGWDVERRDSRAWQRDVGFDPAEVERRRAAIMARGRSQT